MENLHLLRPWWLLGLLPIVVLCWLWARARKTGSRWEAAIAPELLAVLLEKASAHLDQRRVWAVAGALAIATLGLAGPTWERLPQPISQRTDATVLVWDLSLSMFAEDIDLLPAHGFTEAMKRIRSTPDKFAPMTGEPPGSI